MPDRYIFARNVDADGPWLPFLGTEASVILSAFPYDTLIEWNDGLSVQTFRTLPEVPVDALVLPTKYYPTSVGPIIYDEDLPALFGAGVTAWGVSGSAYATISAEGVLTLDSDGIGEGPLDLVITATGAANETGTLTITWEPIVITYDGTNITSVSYPDDTPLDTQISYTPTGGAHNNRQISFTPADLEGLADGEGFFALAPIVTITTDGGTADALDEGDVLDLTAPALALYTGTTVPTMTYSARDADGEVAAGISFPYTVPAGITGSLYIRALDGFGNFIDSAPTPVAETGTEFFDSFDAASYDSDPSVQNSAHYTLRTGSGMTVNGSDQAEISTALGQTGISILQINPVPVGTQNCSIYCDIGIIGPQTWREHVALFARRTDDSNLVEARMEGAGNLVLRKKVAGVTTEVFDPVPSSPGDRYELVISNNMASVLKNGLSAGAKFTNFDVSEVPTANTHAAFGVTQNNATTTKTTIAAIGARIPA